MLTGAVIPELFGQTIVDEEEFITVSSNSHEEIIWFNVSMNEILVVQEFDSSDHLIGEHEHGFHGESSWTKVEQIFQRWTQEVHDQNVIVPFGTIPSNVWNSNTSLEDFIQFWLIKKLGVPCFDRFQFDGNFFAIGDVDAEVYVAKRSWTNFSNQTVFATDHEFRPTWNAGAGHLCWKKDVFHLGQRVMASLKAASKDQKRWLDVHSDAILFSFK